MNRGILRLLLNLLLLLLLLQPLLLLLQTTLKCKRQILGMEKRMNRRILI